MRIPKIYLETTMFNYFFDTDRDGHADTIKLFKEIRSGKYEAFTSAYVVYELMKAEESKRVKMLTLITEYNVTVIPDDNEAQDLADIYVIEGVTPVSKRFDGLHIATATINNLDFIFSFNFQHINRVKTKVMTGLINVRQGYRPITIAAPAEVIEYDE